MIRANFGVDPGTLGEEEWAMLFQQATWVEGFRLESLARILSKLLTPPKE